MTSTRKIAAVLASAAALSCAALSSAHASEASGLVGPPVNPVTELDAIAHTGIPAEQQGRLPTVKSQLAGLSHVNDLRQLHQVTDLGAPVLAFVPAVE